MGCRLHYAKSGNLRKKRSTCHFSEVLKALKNIVAMRLAPKTGFVLHRKVTSVERKTAHILTERARSTWVTT